MATMNISLPKGLKAWVQSRGSGADYSTPSDYVRALIRADKDRELGELQALLLEGVASGDPVLDTSEYREELVNEARRRAAERLIAKPATK